MIRRFWRRLLAFFDVPDMSEAWMRQLRRECGIEELGPPERRGEAPEKRRELPGRRHLGGDA